MDTQRYWRLRMVFVKGARPTYQRVRGVNVDDAIALARRTWPDAHEISDAGNRPTRTTR